VVKLATNLTNYNRTYHKATETSESLSLLPGWMKIHNEDSIGFNFINAILGNHLEWLKERIIEFDKNSFYQTAHHNDPNVAYVTYHNTSLGDILQDTLIRAYIDNTEGNSIPSGMLAPTASSIIPITVSDEREFFMAPPTRLTYDVDDDVYLGEYITGITFAKNYSKNDASGNIITPKQDVYIVNIMNSTPASGEGSTILYNTSWEAIDGNDYGIGYQDYDNTSLYEVVKDPSGYILNYIPIDGTLVLYDYVNVDASGNAQVIPEDNYSINNEVVNYISQSTIIMSGVNPYNDMPIGNSNYFVEYQYKKFDYPKCVTSNSNLWHNQVILDTPTFTSGPTNYNGTKITHTIANTPGDGVALLSVDTRDVRPGRQVNVEFNYVIASDVIWDNNSELEIDLTVDPNYVETNVSGVHVYNDNREITNFFSPEFDSGVFTIPASTVPFNPPFGVRAYYSANKTYSGITAVQSFNLLSGGVDPYPYDYIIEDGYLLPMSIIPVSDVIEEINDELITSYSNQFTVTTELSFDGITFDKDKNCFWMIEKNNISLYKINAVNGGIMDKWNIFKPPNFYTSEYKSMVSGVYDEINNYAIDYPFKPQDIDVDTRDVRGCLYYKDYLYIVSMAPISITIGDYQVGGSGIYRIDTYNDRVMDIEYSQDGEVNPHFPLPIVSGTGILGEDINDISLDNDENIIVAEGNYVKKLKVRYDYTLINSSDNVARGTVFYRELYDGGVDVGDYEEFVE
jgi:hypothetical protein